LGAPLCVVVGFLAMLPSLARSANPLGPEFEPITDEEFHIPVDEATAARIEQSVAMLGAPNFKAREEAEKALVDIGGPALAKLREAYLTTDDFEVRARIEAIVRIIYLDFHVFSNFGFLGIQRDDGHTPGPEDDPRIQPGHCGIRVQQVIAETGAKQAGVLPEDIIIGIDGTPIPGAGRRAFDGFSASIRERRPGARVVLTILRDGEELTLEAVLTRPPPDRRDGGGVMMLRERIERAKARFVTWWFKYFRSATASEHMP